MDFDQERIYYTHQNLQQQNQEVSDDEDNIESSSNVNNEDNNKFDGDYDDVDLKVVRRYLREFLRKSLFRGMALVTPTHERKFLFLYFVKCCIMEFNNVIIITVKQESRLIWRQMDVEYLKYFFS